MLNNTNFSIIFDDSPIARAYLNILIDLNLTNIKIYYLSDKYFFINKINHRINFINKNLYFYKFLNNKSLIDFREEVEKYFKFENGFIDRMFKAKNLNLFKNCEFINNRNVNSDLVRRSLTKSKTEILLNTSRQIFKNVSKLNKKIIHIHPGYLPNVRGADGSLNSIFYRNEIGCTAFFIEEKIDQGKIIKRIKLNVPKFKNLNLEKFSNDELYNLWFTFFDPLLRAYVLKELFFQKKYELIEQIPSQGEYYSFIDKRNIKKILKEITYENLNSFKV